MEDYSQLPHEVLVKILQLVVVRHRLSSCSLVHSTWAAAALAATDDIKLSLHVKVDVDNILYWLRKHGEHLSSLQFYASEQSQYVPLWGTVLEGQVVPCIPSQQLRDLSIGSGSLQLQPPEPTCSSMLAAATGLTSLLLQSCSLSSDTDSLSVLSALTNLQHLELNVFKPNIGALQPLRWEPVWAPVPGGLFSQLVKLTHLDLQAGRGGATQDTFQHFGCLTNLQHLGLSYLSAESADEDTLASEGLVGLSQLTQLTCLELHESRIALTADSTPLLTPLTNLRRLYVFDIDDLDPAVLAGMTQMQDLDLGNCLLLKSRVDVASLLAVLQGMKQLTALELNGALDALPAAAAAAQDVPEGGPQAAAAAARRYGALTASTQLCQLYLGSSQLPPGIWQHIFAPDRQLPHLTQLEFECASRPDEVVQQAGAVDGTDTVMMRRADLSSLAQCCPNLMFLHVDCADIKEAACVEPLLQLTQLTELMLSCRDKQVAADARQLLQQLPRMQSLLL